MSNAATQGDPWWLGAATFGSKLLESSTEVVNDYARAKLRDELKIDEMLAKQRANEATTNPDVLALNAPVKGVNSDGSTLVQEQLTIAGVTVSKKGAQYAGIALATVLLGFIGYKALS